jgi:hypothetical protein
VSTPTAPTVLVSWAHRNTDWDAGQSAAWQAAVETFAHLLRDNGIDAELDLWHVNDPGTDWTRWGPNKVLSCDYVICLVRVKIARDAPRVLGFAV